eukprot:TRINITY_DN2378_c0_g1_i3.p1 TRINITY_DN2378_c0_g1~~TRINITY_DN2378_c0_g1_i3.p1  ORF type:complete len:291 (+),score=38.27 TRINITY_DN2378_c0_g1_i3:403-1275(+)
MYGCFSGVPFDVLKLLANGMNKRYINQVDQSGKSALMIVCEYGESETSFDTVKLLLKKGASLKYKSNEEKMTALMYGMTNKNISLNTVRLLVENAPFSVCYSKCSLSRNYLHYLMARPDLSFAMVEYVMSTISDGCLFLQSDIETGMTPAEAAVAYEVDPSIIYIIVKRMEYLIPAVNHASTMMLIALETSVKEVSNVHRFAMFLNHLRGTRSRIKLDVIGPENRSCMLDFIHEVGNFWMEYKIARFLYIMDFMSENDCNPFVWPEDAAFGISAFLPIELDTKEFLDFCC